MKKVGAVQIKQRRVLQELAENGGTMGDAIRKAGYSESVALTPSKLTNTKSWKAVTDEYLPDDLLAKRHRELLDAKKTGRLVRNGEMVAEYEETDFQAVAKALDMFYRIKGYYKSAPEAEKGLSLSELLGKGALDGDSRE